MKSYALRTNPNPIFDAKTTKRENKTNLGVLVSISHSTRNTTGKRKTKQLTQHKQKPQKSKPKRNLKTIWVGLYWILVLNIFYVCWLWLVFLLWYSGFGGRLKKEKLSILRTFLANDPNQWEISEIFGNRIYRSPRKVSFGTNLAAALVTDYTLTRATHTYKAMGTFP